MIQTLGLPVGPVARPVAAPEPARPDMSEYGASGTPIFGGFLRERGEYNPDMQGLEAISTFEEMRRGDAQVAATLTAMKLPIRSAQWDVVVPDDASKTEREACDFVKKCLFDDLDFSAVLRNALLMLDFGVAAHEDVWEIVNGKVVWKKLAPRLPLTFYRWLTSENGEDLVALEQLGYRGSEYITTQVPANKLSLFTFEQEGQNFTGRSVLRAMYQSWFLKGGLYKVDAIAVERNGSGVPVITMGPNAKTEDKALALQWVQQLAAHQRAGLVLPQEWTFELKGVTGTLRDPAPSIAHHNMQISMAGLAMFMQLGHSGGGNRALGDTMTDFFYLGLEATSKQIGRVLSLGTVKRLVDFNFSGVVNYPRVSPQQIMTIKFETIVAALKDLASSGVVQPDDDLDNWMRVKLGAPEVDQRTARKTQVVMPGKPGDAGVAVGADTVEKPGKVDAGGAKDEAAAEAEKTKKLAAMDTGSVHVDGAMGGEVKLRRTPGVAPVGKTFSGPAARAEKTLAAADILPELDRARDAVAAKLRGARSAIQAEVVNKLVNAPVRSMHRVSVAPDERLIAEVEDVLVGVAEFGRGQVAAERARQLGGAAPADAGKARLAAAAVKRDPLGLYADGIVGEFTNSLTARAANVALDYLRRPAGLSKGEIIRAVESDLDEQSDKWIDAGAGKGVNEAFADGRADGYEEHKDEIGSVVYSALLDINTCEACAAADGEEGATPEDIPGVPNPDCDGGDRCRCVHVFVFSDEGKRAA